MRATTTRNTITTHTSSNTAGFPPAPSEAHQRSVRKKPEQLQMRSVVSGCGKADVPASRCENTGVLRGLAIRIDYAKAKLAHQLIGSASTSDGLRESTFSAEQFGYLDCYGRVFQLPALFKDEPALAEAWHRGQRMADDMIELANCSQCNDDSGNPCAMHD